MLSRAFTLPLWAFSHCRRAGGQCERTQVACNSQHDLQDWLDLLTKHTHAPAAPAHKPQSTCHTVRNTGFFLKSTVFVSICSTSPTSSLLSSAPSQLPSLPVSPSRHSESRRSSVGHSYHTLPHPSSYGTVQSNGPMWGPLEPPSTPKPWSLSCLRPAPPLRPSAALCQKEVLK